MVARRASRCRQLRVVLREGGARAEVALARVEVEGEGANSELLSLRNKADAELAKARKREADKRKAVQREEKALLLLYERCVASGAALGPAVAADGYATQHGDKMPVANEEDGSVSWPMLRR